MIAQQYPLQTIKKNCTFVTMSTEGNKKKSLSETNRKTPRIPCDKSQNCGEEN